MKKGKIIVLLMVSVVLLLSGCYTMNASLVDSGIDAEMTSSKEMEIIGHFVESRRISHWLYAGIGSGSGVMEKIISNTISENPGATGVSNISIEHKNTFITYFLGAITLGLYTNTKVTVEGDLVKRI